MSTISTAAPVPMDQQSQPPKKNQKSRNGCLTCKKKRLKCDETKPACLNCVSKKIECGGYTTNFRWKSFEETATSQKIFKHTSPAPSSKSDTSLSSKLKKKAKTEQKTVDAPQSTQQQKQQLQQQQQPEKLQQQEQQQQHATAMNRSYSMPESATGSEFQTALQQAALSIAGRSPEELAKQAELMKQGKNPYGKASKRSSEALEEENGQETSNEQPNGIKRRGSDPISGMASPGIANMSYSLNINSPFHPHPTDSHNNNNNKRRQTVSVLDQPVLSPGQNSMGSPSLSTLVRAFTEFDSINVPQTPSNIDPLSPAPRILEISRDSESAIEETDSRDCEENSLEESAAALIMSQMPKRSLSMDSALSGSSIPQYRKELLTFSQSLSNTRPPITVHLPFSPNDNAFSPLNMPQHMIPPSDFEKVFQAFDKYTCQIMSIRDEPTENPWRTLIWPLALQHSVLYKSLASMSLFHVARGDESLKKLGVSYMRQAMNELAEGLSSQSIPNEVALATCLTLAMADSWEKHTTTGIAHLKGARSIINKLDRNAIAAKEKLYKFLINVFLYYDVLARMSSLQSVDTDYEENGKLIQNLKRLRAPGDSGTVSPASSTNSSSKAGDASVQSSPNFNELFGSSIFPSANESGPFEEESVIDPLLGCAPGLFLIIGRVASFITKVRNMERLSLSMVSSAVQLKTDLANWKPDGNIRSKLKLEDPSCDVSSFMATAEAYRYSTLLYLQQAVPEVASQSSADLAEKVLMLLASIPTSSKTCLVHIFPLLVASCEMISVDDRQWVKDRWRLLADKMWLGTIDRAVEIVEEVWRRKDMLVTRARAQEPTMGPDETWDMIRDRIDALTRSRKREEQGINSWAHWSTVMKEWKWEVLFG